MPVRIILVLAALVFLALPGAGQAATFDQSADGGAPHQLVPADVVMFRVLNQADLDTQVRVDASGRVAFPYVGLVNVGGMTPGEAAERIGAELGKAGIVRNPEVVASMVSFGTTASVLGSVNAPGMYVLDRPTRLTQLLARAGGVSPQAGKVLKLRRTLPDGTVQASTVDIETLLDGNAPGQNMLVRNNDEVYIPEAEVFYLYGNVNAPGAYPLRRPLTVQQALAVGGGITEIGSDGRIRIQRKDGGGLREYRADLSDVVKPGDVIQVPERIF